MKGMFTTMSGEFFQLQNIDAFSLFFLLPLFPLEKPFIKLLKKMCSIRSYSTKWVNNIDKNMKRCPWHTHLFFWNLKGFQVVTYDAEFFFKFYNFAVKLEKNKLGVYLIYRLSKVKACENRQESWYIIQTPSGII